MAKKVSKLVNVTREQNRTVIAKLVKDYLVSVVCEVLSLRRSTYYYTAKGRDDTVLLVAIREVAGQ